MFAFNSQHPEKLFRKDVIKIEIYAVSVIAIGVCFDSDDARYLQDSLDVC